MLEAIANSVGLGYLIVLAVLGYVSLLVVIKKLFAENSRLSVLRVPLITVHFIMGIVGVMLFPSLYFRDNSSSNEILAPVLFSAVVLLGLVMVFGVITYITKNIEWK